MKSIFGIAALLFISVNAHAEFSSASSPVFTVKGATKIESMRELLALCEQFIPANGVTGYALNGIDGLRFFDKSNGYNIDTVLVQGKCLYKGPKLEEAPLL